MLKCQSRLLKLTQTPAKQNRVKDMKASLESVAKGTATLPPNDELFDPVDDPSHAPATRVSAAPTHRAFKNPRFFAAATLGSGLLAGFLWLVLGRRARKPTV